VFHIYRVLIALSRDVVIQVNLLVLRVPYIYIYGSDCIITLCSDFSEFIGVSFF